MEIVWSSDCSKVAPMMQKVSIGRCGMSVGATVEAEDRRHDCGSEAADRLADEHLGPGHLHHMHHEADSHEWPRGGSVGC